jgi:hypothetical protein
MISHRTVGSTSSSPNPTAKAAEKLSRVTQFAGLTTPPDHSRAPQIDTGKCDVGGKPK